MSARVLPMTEVHQLQVLLDPPALGMLVKTTTLRSKRYAPGVYVMADGKTGVTHGTCAVTGVDDQELFWDVLTPAERQALALTEGYASALFLERTLLRLGHRRFVAGERGLLRHHLAPAPLMLERLLPGEPARACRMLFE